jgi:hypothetical protein
LQYGILKGKYLLHYQVTNSNAVLYCHLSLVSLIGEAISCLRFEVLKAVNIKPTVFWDVTPCNLVEGINVLEELAAAIFSVEVG